MRTATIVLTALFVLMPFQAGAASASAHDQRILELTRQIQVLQAMLNRLILIESRHMNQVQPTASAPAEAEEHENKEVAALDAAWKKREAELDAKYTIPGKWKLLDDKGIKEFEQYQAKRLSLLGD